MVEVFLTWGGGVRRLNPGFEVARFESFIAEKKALLIALLSNILTQLQPAKSAYLLHFM